MRVEERDMLILREVERWRVCGSRHIKFLAGFTGQRATDRRLKILIEAEYLERKKYLYGVPSIYFVTPKGKKLIQSNARPEKVKIEQIVHDMTVLDTAIYFMHKESLLLNDITTEKQLHQLDGFGMRKHRPDFIYTKNNATNCVEVEMTQKSKTRILNIIKDNFIDYDTQFWIVPESQSVIYNTIKNSQKFYTNIKIIHLTEITEHLQKNK